ncbi:MAG TPA: efflux RND transporter periplasmic adaptor subunit [Azospirillaceae bacterium]|nr:efflux RND transporter periplasmic adaptor subunit [Azospirillaceae bacterium]
MNRQFVLAAVITVGTVAWVLSGQFGGRTSPAAPPSAVPAAAEQNPAERPQVRVMDLTAERMVNTLELQGRTQADRIVEVRAEVSGRVEQVLADRGARVRAGDVIARLATNERQTQLERARALVAQRQAEFNAARQLNQRGFQTEIRVAETTAQLESARNELRQAELALERTEIRAPFDGILNQRAVEVGDFLQVGGQIGTIVDLDPIRIVGFVSERNVLELRPGQRGEARVFGTDAVSGSLGFIAASADPATRTFRVELHVPNPDGRVVDGLTAQLRLPVAERMAHRVSASSLTLADDGTIGVKLVGPDDRVAFVPVRIQGDGPEGTVWIAGLPEQVRLITVGQEFVAHGEPVRPVAVQAADADTGKPGR